MKIILLTGASSGIGQVTARLFTHHGYRVFGTSRNPEQAAPISGVTLLPLDVRSPDSIERRVQGVLAQAGRIDVLINNAGMIGPASASEDTSLEHARALGVAFFLFICKKHSG